MKALWLSINKLVLMSLVATFIAGGVSSVAYASAPACAALFAEAEVEVSQVETHFAFLPEYVRFLRKSEEEFFADYAYTIQGVPRRKSTELAMDSANVIDANLNSGRELLTAILNNRTKEHLSGTFIFIDVNNLGWVNKNFADKMHAGDLYIYKTILAIQKIIARDGLIFRLGGDEFGIVLETKDPVAVQKIMKALQDEIHRQAHSVFLRETKRRVEEFKLVHQKYKQGQISESEYAAHLAEFRNYTFYSQEGVSMGASYIDGSPAEAIQNRAEKMATEMKIKIKMAFNLDTSKYTGGVNLSNTENRIQPRFRPDIPPIMSTAQFSQSYTAVAKSDSTQVNRKALLFSRTVSIQSQRTTDVFRIGDYGIGKYKNELTAEEYRLEHYDLNKNTIDSRPIEVNTNTGFMDSRSQAAKVVINHYLNMTATDAVVGETVWVSLLNLGKLNYFHNKTATGDQALKLAAQALRNELTKDQVPFKHNGSDFFILSMGMTKEEAAKYKKTLKEKLNSDSSLDEIFLKEIKYIQQTEKDPQVRELRIDEVRKLMVKKYQVR